MTTNEKQNKQPEAGKKELTPRQIQMRKKMVVFPLFFLAFAGCMWLIFSPGEKEREEPSAGFNTELPTPESEGILSDKRDAYVQEEMRRREREKMRPSCPLPCRISLPALPAVRRELSGLPVPPMPTSTAS